MHTPRTLPRPLLLLPAARPTRTAERPDLLTAEGRFDASAIMALAHSLARDDVADAARRGRTRRYRIALRNALTSAWQTAQAHRHCHQRAAASAALPASHAAILAERTTVLMGIDSGRRMVAELAIVDARAAAIGVRL